MEKFKATICVELEFEFDRNDPDFKDALGSFTTHHDRDGGIVDMLKHVAWHRLKFGPDAMIECVGHLHFHRDIPRLDPPSGIYEINEPDIQIDDYEICNDHIKPTKP
jgi:hypothetical protein